MKVTRQDTIAILDAMDENLRLAESIIRETRATFNKARRMMGLETDIVVGTDGEDADLCPKGGAAG